METAAATAIEWLYYMHISYLDSSVIRSQEI